MTETLGRYGTVLQAWSPLACAKGDIFHNPLLSDIAEKHKKTIVLSVL